MTDEADGSLVPAELLFAIFWECDNQRLSPWRRPFSCSPDPVTDLCQNINKWSTRRLEQVLLVYKFFLYYQLRHTSPFSAATTISTSSRRIVVDLLLWADCNPELHSHGCIVISSNDSGSRYLTNSRIPSEDVK